MRIFNSAVKLPNLRNNKTKRSTRSDIKLLDWQSYFRDPLDLGHPGVILGHPWVMGSSWVIMAPELGPGPIAWLWLMMDLSECVTDWLSDGQRLLRGPIGCRKWYLPRVSKVPLTWLMLYTVIYCGRWEWGWLAGQRSAPCLMSQRVTTRIMTKYINSRQWHVSVTTVECCLCVGCDIYDVE